MISDIYRKYFQKSFTFLYPLLGFKKGKHPRPVQTFLSWEGTVLKPTDRKLICVYKIENTPQWETFERDFLITHKMLDMCIPVDEETIVYIFDMNTVGEDYDVFLEGKYSRLSPLAKKALNDYYGVHTPEWVYIESFLYPQKYFKQYAAILDVEVDLLESVGELCEKFNYDKETCQVLVPDGIEFIV